ncbi:NYN domain-containing protein [uncultured Methanolobus sp.]|uniref:NYN domain-containing protein n=1 Tax=uncultured Methanolobus sp. TaxID=218300 RepID=UPI002AAC363C|nr:NYN domain-containing protein [uncultured Methanolobus sp.]
MEKEIYAFIDNSNIFIEAQRAYAKENYAIPDYEPRFRLDFGKLFDHISSSRGQIFFDKGEDNHYPKLYGSEPPKMDSLWRFLERKGVDVRVFTRNAFNKEKEVDAALVWDVAKLVIKAEDEDNSNKIIAIAGGDKDFLSLYEKGKNAGFDVEFYSWNHSACYEIQELPTFYDLTPVIKNIGFLEKDRFEHNFGDTDWGNVVSYD